MKKGSDTLLMLSKTIKNPTGGAVGRVF